MTNVLLAAFGGMEIMWIAIVVLVLFGAKKVPELMKGVGQGIKEFKKASRDVQEEMHRAMEESETAATPQPRKPADTVSQTGSAKA
jgi:sec-independent protein translocase protein TatA